MTSDVAEDPSAVSTQPRPNGSHHRVNYELRNNPEHRARVSAARRTLFTLPQNEAIEMPGHPNVAFELRDYGRIDGTPQGFGSRAEGAAQARTELPFLFKAFESGQAPPPRPGTKKAEETRAATIHEYLDWTLTRQEGLVDDDKVTEKADFEGFLTIILYPRHKVSWPAPGQITESPAKVKLGAPRPALPALEVNYKAICAATIRAGVGYLEVPFFATHESRRNKGYGRALLECIEEVARGLQLPVLMLCSTDDPVTKNTWKALGFSFTADEDLQRFGVHMCDLLHMDNTVQMHRVVPPKRVWRSVVLKHEDFQHRLYYPLDPRPERMRVFRPPTKTPPKRKVSKKSSKKSYGNGMLSSE